MFNSPSTTVVEFHRFGTNGLRVRSCVLSFQLFSNLIFECICLVSGEFFWYLYCVFDNRYGKKDDFLYQVVSQLGLLYVGGRAMPHVSAIPWATISRTVLSSGLPSPGLPSPGAPLPRAASSGRSSMCWSCAGPIVCPVLHMCMRGGGPQQCRLCCGIFDDCIGIDHSWNHFTYTRTLGEIWRFLY